MVPKREKGSQAIVHLISIRVNYNVAGWGLWSGVLGYQGFWVFLQRNGRHSIHGAFHSPYVELTVRLLYR